MGAKNNAKNPRVDLFLSKTDKWQREFVKLRKIVLDCGLTEELKWGQPCYTFEGSNVVLLHGFKDYCAILFIKGALLKDSKKVLIQQTKNVQAARQIRFTNAKEITEMESTVIAYIREAIKIERAGLKVGRKETADFEVAEEFQSRLDRSAALRKAFTSLTPGRQRAYLLHFSAPKQSKTRESRVEKCIPQILKGKGLLDSKT